MNSETGIAGAERGVNIVIDELPVWRAPHFIGAEPRWMTVISSGLCLVPGGALAYLAALASAIPAAVVVPLAIASALALLALWFERSPVDYVADARGVYFPSPRKLPMTGRGQARRWLFVPWSNIARIGVQPLLDESGRNGVTFCLCVSDAERRLYFPRAAALDPGGIAQQDGMFDSRGVSRRVQFTVSDRLNPARVAAAACGRQCPDRFNHALGVR